MLLKIGFLEATGILAIISVIGYLILQFADRKEYEDKEKNKLMANNKKCREIRRENLNAMDEGKPYLTERELDKILNEVINDPDEKRIAYEKINEDAVREERRDIENRNMRKIGYKYEIEIFEIFYIDPVLSEDQLLLRIGEKFSLNETRSKELFVVWSNNRLIREIYDEPNHWQVGHILTFDIYSLDETDLTWQKWLDQQEKRV